MILYILAQRCNGGDDFCIHGVYTTLEKAKSATGKFGNTGASWEKEEDALRSGLERRTEFWIIDHILDEVHANGE